MAGGRRRDRNDDAPARPAARPRPALFRALGAADPPTVVEIDGERFERREISKHDSWAASGIYESATGRAFCKFNRVQPVLGIPMRWLGRRLATRERAFLERLGGIEGIPGSLGRVSAEGRALPNAVARRYVAGHALMRGDRVDDAFFPRLRRIVAEVHAQNVAHVDLHKRENILVDAWGRPHLIDFQISFVLPTGRIATALAGGLLRVLQECDRYHLLKHETGYRPDVAGLARADLARLRPWWIRMHRRVAVPLRSLRRGLLVWLGIRETGGSASSEAFPEVAHRPVEAAPRGVAA